MKRIGDLLIERGLIEPEVLERALAKQLASGQRLCSFLIASGALTPDDAARALGEQHGVPALLQKHLAHRDPALADRLPAAFAREHHVLPIGRTGAGDLIVYARDPRPTLHDQLARVTNERVVLATAPAAQLAVLIAESYAAVPMEVDVELASGSITGTQVPDLTDDPSVDLTVDLDEPDATFSELGPLTLVELDDRRVTRDLTQSGSFALGPLPAVGRAPTSPAIARTATTPRTSLAAMLTGVPPPNGALAAGSSVERVIERAMQLAAERWRAALLLAIRDRLALGHRGHGDALGADAVRGIAIPLSAPSMVRDAHATGACVTARPEGAGAIQDRLERLLARPAAPAAMPIAVGGAVAFVLLVGDPVTGDAATSAHELERFGVELAAALARLAVT